LDIDVNNFADNISSIPGFQEQFVEMKKKIHSCKLQKINKSRNVLRKKGEKEKLILDN
jgi:hypothetical protein